MNSNTARMNGDHQTSAKPVNITRENVAGVVHKMPFHMRAMLRALTRLDAGTLTMRLPGGHAYRFEAARPGPVAEVVLHNWALATPRAHWRINRRRRELHGWRLGQPGRD